METIGTPRRRAPYEARPGRSALVAERLDSLTGPTSGRVALPLHLSWQKNNTFDLDVDFHRKWLYQIVLREAVGLADLTIFLNAELLVELWPRLTLPRGVRAAWEEQHPVLRDLRPARPAAAA